ncbi:glycosyltransferase family 2 protein [Lichenicola cladoniae]|uniref:Glycosyltransferase family 2 protein n=1 Tax=Lichenicola cladoniae TaxID=1484109 RepID=A0A6M8HV35_9PROT|nr:glycosyltransferase family 2 protein [Lichenicola cladoniae]NPD67131.1 glycosyltransferase family 2 protein [Acetobacteraceae bacterium]QKE92464.1 glycosyltransferase family 2 protein [Lichenicola cladoniae]
MPARSVLTVVVPCFNESAGLLDFHERLSAVMSAIGESWDVLYVNDGSRDRTLPLIEALTVRDPHAGLLNLSRNFGKEIALTAGLDHASATGAVIVIDADLQDPPEVIPSLVAQWRQGFEMVYAQRAARSGDSWTKRTTAHGFYLLMQRLGGRVLLPRDTGDFRLIGRRALDALLQLREHHRFMKGLFAWVGFPSVAVSYDRAARTAGESSWNYWSLWNLAIEGITAFTVVPLKIATYAGLLVALFALLFGGQLVIRTMMFGNHVPGYPSLMAVVLFLGGVQLMTLGVIGEYLGRIFNETKHRPLYLVERYSAAGLLERYGAAGPPQPNAGQEV